MRIVLTCIVIQYFSSLCLLAQEEVKQKFPCPKEKRQPYA